MSTTSWIFAYGSLLWNPGFTYKHAKLGFSKGFKRRFWQGSNLHRGQPDQLGRVVTLVPDRQAYTWGAALEVENGREALAYLNNREQLQGGYDTLEVDFYPSDQSQQPFPALTYIALPVNSLYLGSASYAQMAYEISVAQGTCGLNIAYLANLLAFMKTQFPTVVDNHLHKLEVATLKLLQKEKQDKLLAVFDNALQNMEEISCKRQGI